MDCIRCGNPVEYERVGPFAQCKSCDDAHAEAQEEAVKRLEIKKGLDYLTRDSTRASVWSWGKNLLGKECWRGTVEGGGLNCWDENGKDMSGTTEWDLVSLKGNALVTKEKGDGYTVVRIVPAASGRQDLLEKKLREAFPGCAIGEWSANEWHMTVPHKWTLQDADVLNDLGHNQDLLNSWGKLGGK